jgi:predicted amino acid-binding ACT domain protein
MERGKGELFVRPLQGDREFSTAAQVSVNVTYALYPVRVLGHDRLEIAAELIQRLADAGINLRGFAAFVIGTRFVVCVAVDSLQDANQGIEIMVLGRNLIAAFVRD